MDGSHGLAASDCRNDYRPFRHVPTRLPEKPDSHENVETAYNKKEYSFCFIE
jgi:hypothetical protein